MDAKRAKTAQARAAPGRGNAMVAVTPTAAANALLRPAIHEFELAMDPLVKAWAKTKWGEVQKAGWALPQWAWHICYECIGREMRDNFDHMKLFDAFTLGEVVQKNMGEFVQAHLPTLSDAEREHYHNAVYHVGFMRHALAHSPEPSTAECVQGVYAVLEVLQRHGADDAQVLRLTELRRRLQLIAGTATGAAQPVHVSAEELRMVLLESAMQHFAATVGYEAHGRYKPHDMAPPLPIDVAGKYNERKSICTLLGYYHEGLKDWNDYKVWIKKPQSRMAVQIIEDTRHALNHGRIDDIEERRRGLRDEWCTERKFHNRYLTEMESYAAAKRAKALNRWWEEEAFRELAEVQLRRKWDVAEEERRTNESWDEAEGRFVHGEWRTLAEFRASYDQEELGRWRDARLAAELRHLQDIHAGLKLPTHKLEGFRKALAAAAAAGTPLELSAAEGPGQRVIKGTRIPLPSGSDPRTYLVGRDKLVADVAARLGAAAWSREVLHGESGVGKTVAAWRICDEVSTALPWQVSMHGSSVLTLRAELARFARMHVPGLAEDAKEEEAVEAARKALAGGWLLLVDDVGPDLDGVLELLPTRPDGSPAGHVLLTMTGQRSSWPEHVFPTLVGQLSLDEAMDLLRKGGPDKKVKEEVLTTKDVGVRSFLEEVLSTKDETEAESPALLLPLDVALLKSALLAAQEGAKRYKRDVLAEAKGVVGRWREQTMASLQASDARDPQRRNMRRRHGGVWELIRRLNEWCAGKSRLLEASRALLAMASVLATTVPPQLFQADEQSVIPEGSEGLPAEEALFRSEELFHAAADALEAVGLAEVLPDRGLRMHRLLQCSLRWLLLHQQDELKISILDMSFSHSSEQLVLQRGPAEPPSSWCVLYDEIMKRFVAKAAEHKHRATLEALAPSVNALYEQQQESQQWTLCCPQLAGSREFHLTRAAGYVLHVLHRARLAEGLGLWHRQLGGRAHWDRAARLLRDALTMRHEALGDRDLDTLASDNLAALLASKDNLAALLSDMGKYEEAMELMEEVLEVRSKVLGDDHLTTLASKSNFAMLLTCMGEHKKARPLAEKALEGRRTKLGCEHPDTLTSMTNLATLLRDMGELKEARLQIQEARDASLRVLGNDHPSTLTNISILAMLMVEMDECMEARPLMEEALERRRKELGESHPETLESINNLGLLLQNMGLYDEARLQFEKVLKVSFEEVGPQHPHTLTSMANLGLLLMETGSGKYKEARNRYNEARELYKEAREWMVKALEGRRVVLRAWHPDTLESVNNLGLLLYHMRRYKEAKPRMEEAEERCRKELGNRHPKTLNSINNLGMLREAMDRPEEAKELYEEALTASREVMGNYHAKTLTTMYNLATLLMAMSNLREARPLVEDALEGVRVVSGDRHPNDPLVAMGKHLADLSRQLQEAATNASSTGRRASARSSARARLEMKRRLARAAAPAAAPAATAQSAMSAKAEATAEALLAEEEAEAAEAAAAGASAPAKGKGKSKGKGKISGKGKRAAARQSLNTLT